jgi:hypothetical protein
MDLLVLILNFIIYKKKKIRKIPITINRQREKKLQNTKTNNSKNQEKINIADTAYSLWKNKTFEERAVFMNRLYHL